MAVMAHESCPPTGCFNRLGASGLDWLDEGETLCAGPQQLGVWLQTRLCE